MKSAAWLFAFVFAAAVPTFAQSTELRATGEHRATPADTADAARRFALVDARKKTWQAAISRLQGLADVKALGLRPRQLDAYVAVLLDVEETGTASTRTPVQVHTRAAFDQSETLRRMTALHKDQDAAFHVADIWRRVEPLHDRLAAMTLQRTKASPADATSLLQDQLRLVDTIDASLLTARAVAALARTEHVTVGGRAPSDAGRTRARALVQAAFALREDLADAHVAMGDLLVDARQPDAAEAEFRKALATEPGHTLGRIKLAEAVRLQGRFAEAITELREVLRADPSFVRAHSDLAMVLRAEGDVEAAVAEYQAAIKLDGDWIDARNGLAVAFATSGRLDDALTEFREIIRIDPDSAIGYYNLAFALAEADRDVESAAALREVIRINPEHYNARFNLGELFRLEGKYDDAARQFREYVRLAPDTPQNRRNLERARGYIEKFTN